MGIFSPLLHSFLTAFISSLPFAAPLFFTAMALGPVISSYGIWGSAVSSFIGARA